MLALDLCNADILYRDGLAKGDVYLSAGRLRDRPTGHKVDLSGYMVLPGIIDLHGDAFERHLAPRRGAMTQTEEGLVCVDAEMAANGITTGFMAQFVSWEGGVRGEKFADRVFSALSKARPNLLTDIRPQLRFETHLLELYEQLPDLMEKWGAEYIVFNDHLPHDRLAEGRKPPRLTGQALKAGRNPDAHFEFLLELHARSPQIPAALDALCAKLSRRNLVIGSHDDHEASDRSRWHARGALISEFPETISAAQAALENGNGTVLGAPNIVRGASHKGNVSAQELVKLGLCSALASDYHYPSLRRAALQLTNLGIVDFPTAWAMLSSGPARIMGLTDRGHIAPGLRADLVILDAQKNVAATFAEGAISYMSGPIAERFFGAVPPNMNP